VSSTIKLKKIYLTAVVVRSEEEQEQNSHQVTKAQALKHPNWTMGAKVTIDSATLMNKGLEVIEAKWLFSLKPEQIDVIVHPQSIVHSLVAVWRWKHEGTDGLAGYEIPIHLCFLLSMRVKQISRDLILSIIRNSRSKNQTGNIHQFSFGLWSIK